VSIVPSSSWSWCHLVVVVVLICSLLTVVPSNSQNGSPSVDAWFRCGPLVGRHEPSSCFSFPPGMLHIHTHTYVIFFYNCMILYFWCDSIPCIYTCRECWMSNFCSFNSCKMRPLPTSSPRLSTFIFTSPRSYSTISEDCCM